MRMRRGARVIRDHRRACYIWFKVRIVLEQCPHNGQAAADSNDTPENRTPHPDAISRSVPEVAGRAICRGGLAPRVLGERTPRGSGPPIVGEDHLRPCALPL